MRPPRKPGLAVVVCLLLSGFGLSRTRADEVPLALWTSPSFPGGLDIGYTMGVSWGDYDADGYIDLFACFSGSLWHNVHGVSWEFAGNLSDLVPPAERRYGSSFGDYDRDGLPDIAMAPRTPAFGDDRFHLLHNLGAGGFTDVAGDPSILDVQPYGNAETLCWADVDGDRMLDLFIPVYPGALGPGNFFLHNIGNTVPNGPVGFAESSQAVGLDNVPGNARPEGAQFADVDDDGDPDLYAGGTLYQNVSTRGNPQFNPLASASTGITRADQLDEGAMFFDYDLDGDQDLFVAYTVDGVKILENRGDGTFFEAEAGIIDDPMSGLDLGMSAEDWDNDGDIDFTTRDVFRQNMLMEEGTRHFTVATTSIPPDDLTSATPAWGDWDRDGDLDCALGNWGSFGRLYENTLYTPATNPAEKRHVRIRVVGNSAVALRGLETEYGATAEIKLGNVADGFTRRKFVASGHGYLNQNEYALHFALPADPYPSDPQEDVHFGVSVDFPGVPLYGLWRIDQHVNPVLGDLNLAALTDREITVYRCGQVVLDGITYDPIPTVPKSLTTTTKGLVLPNPGGPPPDPVPAPQSDWYTGLAFNTTVGFGPVEIEEILLDGQLDAAPSCGPASNIAIWDVTDPDNPFLVSGDILRQTSSRNRRSRLTVDAILPPSRSYRLVARVTEYRSTTIGAPIVQGPVTVLGGLSFPDADPCSGQGPAVAQIDPSKVAIALRFRALGAPNDPVGPTLRLSRGFHGSPALQWLGIPVPEYQVLRCNAASGPCTPVQIAKATETSYIDRNAIDPPHESFWYLVKGIDECAAGP